MHDEASELLRPRRWALPQLSRSGHEMLMSEELTQWRQGFARWIRNSLAQEIAAAQIYAETLASQPLSGDCGTLVAQLQETILNAAFEVASVARLLEYPPARATPAGEPKPLG